MWCSNISYFLILNVWVVYDNLACDHMMIKKIFCMLQSESQGVKKISNQDL